MTLAISETAADWVRCPACNWLLYGKRLARNDEVCVECGHHFRLTARRRLHQLVDAGTFRPFEPPAGPPDPLRFADLRPYADRLTEARARTGEREAVLTGTAEICGRGVVVAVMEFGFLGGSMGTAVGSAIAHAAETALELRQPLILVCSSGGARMQEGILSLMQMVRTAQALGRLQEAGVPSVSVLTDPTYGGVTASFAMLASVVVAEAGALVGFAGRRVIEQTIRQQLPAGFQSAAFLRDHGLVDDVIARAELRPYLARLLGLHAGTAGTASAGGAPTVRDPGALVRRDPWEVVQLARSAGRPTALDYLDLAFTDFCELHGDRAHGDDPAIVGGPARLGDRTVMVIAHQKGHDTRELVARNFGMPHPEGYRKALRLLEYAERFAMPVVTLIDTPGAYPGVEAEQRGQAGAIAEMIMRSARLRVPVVAVVTGEGGSGGALALGTADRLLVLANAFYSVISPEGCAAILWRSPGAAPSAARALRLTAPDLLEQGVADAVVPEPAGGAQDDPAAAAANLRRAVLSALDELRDVDPVSLVDRRYERYAAMDGRHLAREAA